MTIIGPGIRDISRVLKVSINTALETIREQASRVADPSPPSRITDLGPDGMWSFVGKKANQRWLRYGLDPARKRIICWQAGRRTDATCQKLLAKLEGSQVLRYCTDDREAYQKSLPVERHWIGKEATQEIGRNKLNVRTDLKRYQRRRFVSRSRVRCMMRCQGFTFIT